MRIAVLDHDPAELDSICSILNAAGHSSFAYSGGNELVQQMKRDSVDMLVLDWQVFDLTGTEILQWIRDKQHMAIPILFMTNRAGEDDIVDGLAAGANDYMIKPIRRSELVARVQALLRRSYPNQHMPENLEFGPFIFETRSARLSVAGEFVDLTQKEFDLALLLFRNVGRPLSRAYILEEVWSRDADIPSRTLDTHISRVRNKLQLRPEHGFKLSPVYSYGYRLEQVANE
ncbi:DNA-binding response OmpR family regulator [Oxalobacteraceae bacterium GrIS 2.11]